MTDGKESINCTFLLSLVEIFLLKDGVRQTGIKMSASVCCTRNGVIYRLASHRRQWANASSRPAVLFAGSDSPDERATSPFLLPNWPISNVHEEPCHTSWQHVGTGHPGLTSPWAVLGVCSSTLLPISGVLLTVLKMLSRSGDIFQLHSLPGPQFCMMQIRLVWHDTFKIF